LSAAPRISVLMPCRDAAAHLTEAIASLEAQTFRDFEVIAVDDGSRDATPHLLQQWSRRNRAVHVLSTPGHGLVASLEAARLAASGAILARMDSDDISHPERFEQQLLLLDAEPDIAACGSRVRYFPQDVVQDGARRYESWINGLVTPDSIERDLFVECPIPHPTLMIRREVLAGVGGYRDNSWPEDYDLVLRVWAAGHRMSKVPGVLLDWRESADRLSRTDPRYSEDSFRRCKVHWLRRTLLRRQDRVVIWGAGPVGKSFARAFAAIGIATVAFVDVDPRKIGQMIHGAPVIPATGLFDYAGVFAIAAVGSAEARAEIRASLAAIGRRELREYCAVA